MDNASAFLITRVQHAVPEKSSMLFVQSSRLDGMSEPTTFGERLAHARLLRKKQGEDLSGEKLAALVVRQGGRMTKASVSELERGVSKKAEVQNALYLARALRVRFEWLVAGEQPMEGVLPLEVTELANYVAKVEPPLRADIVKTLWLYAKHAVNTQSAQFIGILTKESKSRKPRPKEPA